MSEARKITERDEERMLVQISVAELKRVVAEAVREARAANTQREYLDKPQLAKVLGNTTRNIELMIKAGMPHLMCGSRPRFKLDEVEAWMRKRATKE